MKINTNHSSFDAFFSLSLEISCVPNCMYTCLGLRLRLPVFLKPLLLWSSVSSGRDYLDRRGKKVVKIMTLVHLCSFSFSFSFTLEKKSSPLFLWPSSSSCFLFDGLRLPFQPPLLSLSFQTLLFFPPNFGPSLMFFSFRAFLEDWVWTTQESINFMITSFYLSHSLVWSSLLPFDSLFQPFLIFSLKASRSCYIQG